MGQRASMTVRGLVMMTMTMNARAESRCAAVVGAAVVAGVDGVVAAVVAW